MRILVCIGTRPEAIKMLPLVAELRKRSEFEVKICHSGQHGEMAEQVFEYFGVEPEIRLEIMRAGQGLAEMTSRLLENFDVVFEQERPDLTLVHGDTVTALCASLAAFYKGVRVAHIEAGLRTHDLRSPFPEELNRVVIDAVSDYCFAPTSLAAENLAKEGKKSVFTVGNTVIDALKYTLDDGYSSPLLKSAESKKIVLLTAHRRENIGSRMRGALLGIRDVLSARRDMLCILPAHPNPEVRGVMREVFNDIKNIKICEPLPLYDFHNLLARAHAVFTDSGGIQEEAAYLGVPVFLLREDTERPEATEGGNVLAVGVERQHVSRAILSVLEDGARLRKMKSPSLLFGDGTASQKIADALSVLELPSA